MARRSSNRQTAKRQSRNRVRRTLIQRGGLDDMKEDIKNEITHFYNNKIYIIYLSKLNKQFQSSIEGEDIKQYIINNIKTIVDIIYAYLSIDSAPKDSKIIDLQNPEIMYYVLKNALNLLDFIEDKSKFLNIYGKGSRILRHEAV